MLSVDRERRAFAAVFALLEAAILVPLWSAPHLPFVDWPEHLAALAILGRLGSGSAFDAARYATDLFPNTNVAFFAMAAPLASWLGDDAAGRVVVSLYLLALPISVALLARAASGGGTPWASLLTFPIVYQTPLQMGFVNWVLALPVLFAYFAAQLRWYRDPRPVRALFLAAAPIFLFVAHAQALLFALGATGAIALYLRLPRRFAAIAAALVPSLALLAWWYAGHFGGAGAGTSRFVGASAGFGAQFEPVSTRLRTLAGCLVGIYPGHEDEALMWGWLALLVGWVLATRRAPWTPGRRAVAALCAAAALGYLALPDRIAQQWFIASRMLPVAAALAVAALPTGFPPVGRRWLLGGAVAVPLGLVAVLTREYRAFGPVIDDALQLIDALPPGEKLLGLPFDEATEHAEHRVYQHVPAYYLARVPGVLGHSFFTLPSYPVRLRDPGPPLHEGHAAELDAWCGLLHGENADSDWLLVRGDDQGLLLALAPAVELAGTAGEWRLYHRSAPIALTPAAAVRLGRKLHCADW